MNFCATDHDFLMLVDGVNWEKVYKRWVHHSEGYWLFKDVHWQVKPLFLYHSLLVIYMSPNGSVDRLLLFIAFHRFGVGLRRCLQFELDCGYSTALWLVRMPSEFFLQQKVSQTHQWCHCLPVRQHWNWPHVLMRSKAVQTLDASSNLRPHWIWIWLAINSLRELQLASCLPGQHQTCQSDLVRSQSCEFFCLIGLED